MLSTYIVDNVFSVVMVAVIGKNAVTVEYNLYGTVHLFFVTVNESVLKIRT